jgi:hypothetical protein
MPGLMTSPNRLEVMSYLLVLAAAGGALVLLLVVSLGLWLQPANTPTVRPNSAIRVSNLFIVALTLTKLPARTSKKLPYLPRWRCGVSSPMPVGFGKFPPSPSPSPQGEGTARDGFPPTMGVILSSGRAKSSVACGEKAN